MDRLDMVDRLVISTFVGSMLGFDIAWILMKIPRIDMAMNTGILIPVGLLTGTATGIVLAVLKIKIRPFIAWGIAAISALPSIYVLMSMGKDLHAASIVMPIMVREGVGMRETDITMVLISTVVFFSLGLSWSIFAVSRRYANRR